MQLLQVALVRCVGGLSAWLRKRQQLLSLLLPIILQTIAKSEPARGRRGSVSRDNGGNWKADVTRHRLTALDVACEALRDLATDNAGYLYTHLSDIMLARAEAIQHSIPPDNRQLLLQALVMIVRVQEPQDLHQLVCLFVCLFAFYIVFLCFYLI